MKKISLFVNSNKIPLNRFVTKFLINTIEGMISSLRGVKSPYHKIEVVIEESSSDERKKGDRI